MKTILILTVMLYGSQSFAQLPDKVLFNKAMDKVSHDTLVCSVYLTYVEKAIKSNPSATQYTIDKYKDEADKALQLSSQAIAATDQSEAERAEVLKARMSSAYEKMSTQIDRNFNNMSVLFKKYAAGCQAWLRNPDAEMLRTIKKTWADHGADPTEMLKKLAEAQS